LIFGRQSKQYISVSLSAATLFNPMKKRQRSEERRSIPLSPNGCDVPPSAPPDFTPPTPKQILDRLKHLSELHPPRPDPPRPLDPPASDFLSRLRAISSGATLPIPTSLPRIELLPPTGVALDSLSELSLPSGAAQTAADEPPAPNRAPIGEILRYDEPLGLGIGRALRYISSHGVLVEHRGDDEQLLEYRDEDGRLLDTKAAFKHQSHIFGGKRPGERQWRRQAAKRRATEVRDAARPGDTPLHTASALRRTLAEKAQPFIEISGDRAVGAIPCDPREDRQPRKRRIKLKKRKADADDE
jgi:hypothetical protein